MEPPELSRLVALDDKTTRKLSCQLELIVSKILASVITSTMYVLGRI